MADIDNVFRHLSVADVYSERLKDLLLKLRWGTTVNILVVVDEEVSTRPDRSFGIRSVIEMVRAGSVGCMSFNVDIARRDALPSQVVATPDITGAKYTGFRFDMRDADGVTPLLQRYQQVWCFGFKPDNFGLDDGRITLPGAFPASDAELAVLAAWMDERKGGVFATGDHDYLGASMCHRIPRVRTMRRWTNADGVPPIGTPARIDTLRPGTEPLANTTDQEDTTPQPIQWVAWASIRLNWFRRLARPHPVLCHPTLGPIDVMPDHAHEGLCFDTHEVALAGSYDFDASGSRPEYPNAPSGEQVRPLVIAYGSTLDGDEYDFEKGTQPYRPRFPMISVYDGHRADRGRVAVDSTWHHWMNVNIDNLAAAGGPAWEKIKRYYLNLAVWLNPPGFGTRCLFEHLAVSHFGYAGLQEYSQRMTTRELGIALRAQLRLFLGPCWVTQWVFDRLLEIDPKRFAEIFAAELRPIAIDKPWPPFPDPCLSCPPIELIEDMVLGGIVRATLPMAAEARAALAVGKTPRNFSIDAFEKAGTDGITKALVELNRQWTDSMKRTQVALKPLLS